MEITAHTQFIYISPCENNSVSVRMWALNDLLVLREITHINILKEAMT